MFDESEPLTRGRSSGDGEFGIPICDFLLLDTIMLTAHASKSTGVRLAAWMKGSSNCRSVSTCKKSNESQSTYEKNLRRRSSSRVLD